MTKPWLGRLPWLAAMVALGGILLLAARVHVQTLESQHLTALVSCVLLAPAVDPSTSPAGVPEAMIPDCEASPPTLSGRPG